MAITHTNRIKSVKSVGFLQLIVKITKLCNYMAITTKIIVYVFPFGFYIRCILMSKSQYGTAIPTLSTHNGCLAIVQNI